MRCAPSRPATLDERFEVLNPRVLRALRAGHEALDRLGVRHVLVGGLAVGIYGRVRVTKDVDFLVGSEAFDSVGVLVSFRPGIPLSAEGVPIDSILAPTEHEGVLGAALVDPVIADGIPATQVKLSRIATERVYAQEEKVLAVARIGCNQDNHPGANRSAVQALSELC